MHHRTVFSVFLLVSLLLAMPVNANIQVTTALEWGIPSLDKTVEVNGFVFASGRYSNNYFLFEEDDSGWELVQKIEVEATVNPQSSLLKLDENKVAVVSSQGVFSTFQVDDNGDISEFHYPLPELSGLQGYVSTFTIINDQLIVIAEFDRKLYSYSLSQNSTNLTLSSVTELGLDGGTWILNLESYQDTLWISDSNSLKQFSTKDGFKSFEHKRTIQAPEDGQFTALKVINNSLVVGRRGESSGFFYLNLSIDGLPINTNLNPSFEDDFDVESISRFHHLEGNYYLVVYSTSMAIVNFANIAHPSTTSSLLALEASFGQAFYKGNKLTIPVGALGFRRYEIEGLEFTGTFENFSKQSADFRAINIINNNIYLSRYGNAGLLRLSAIEIQQLINKEITELDESFDFSGEAPNCFVEDDEYAYAIRDNILQINLENGEIAQTGLEYPLNSSFGVFGDACLLLDNMVFFGGWDGHFWYVDIKDIHDPSKFNQLKIENAFGFKGGTIGTLITDGHRVYASDSDNLYVYQQDANGNWVGTQSFNLVDIANSVEELHTFSQYHLNSIEIVGDLLLVTSNATGYVISFDISDDNLNVQEVILPAYYSAEGAFVYKDYYIVLYWGEWFIYELSEDNRLELLSVFEHDILLPHFGLYENLLVVISSDGTLSVVEITDCEDRFTDEACDEPSESNVPISTKVKFDFDGDGKADIGARRPSAKFWYINNSSKKDLLGGSDDGITRLKFGLKEGDIPVPADYDGDGYTDLAVRRPSTQMWYILNSSGIDPITGYDDGITRRRFGLQTTDIPVPADYDGDGKADIAVRRPINNTWYVLNSSGKDLISQYADGITRRRFGLQDTDIPIPADYDGDGKADLAFWRESNSTWYVLNSGGVDTLENRNDGITRKVLDSMVGDKPVPADYDGDGKTDMALRAAYDLTWTIHNSSGTDPISGLSDGISRYSFGINTSDVLVPADYDGDGKADLAVRILDTQTWYILNSAGEDLISGSQLDISILEFANKSEDIPLAADILTRIEMAGHQSFIEQSIAMNRDHKSLAER